MVPWTIRSLALVATLFGALPGRALAACPSDCVAGGGPPANDCLVQWGGVTATKTICTDGDPACDQDGVADGVCTFGVQGCLNVPSAGCTPAALTAAPVVKPAADSVARALAAQLAALDPGATGCTPGGVTVPVRVTLDGLLTGKAKLTVVATAGTRKDKDKLKLVCKRNLTAPSLASVVQPIFTARCAIPSCHSGPSPSQGETLEAGRTHAANVNVRSSLVPTLMIVKPGSLRGSLMARKLLGAGIPRFGGATMPQGCPNVPPAGGCLTEPETYTILSWIKNGAQDN